MTAEPINIDVSFPITLDTIVEHRPTVRYDHDGDPYGGPAEGVPLIDAIIDRAAEQIVRLLVQDDRYKSWRTEAMGRMRQKIDERIKPIIDQAFEGPIPLTSSYGEPTGKTTTLRELVVEAAHSHMKRNRGARYDSEKSPFDKAIERCTSKVIEAELAAEVTAAKATIQATIKNAAANVLTAAVAKQLGVN